MHKPHTHRPKFVMWPNTAFVAGFTNLADYFWLLVGSPWSPGLEFIMVIRQQTAFWQSRRFRREDCGWLVGWLVGSELCCRWMQKKKKSLLLVPSHAGLSASSREGGTLCCAYICVPTVWGMCDAVAFKCEPYGSFSICGAAPRARVILALMGWLCAPLAAILLIKNPLLSHSI